MWDTFLSSFPYLGFSCSVRDWRHCFATVSLSWRELRWCCSESWSNATPMEPEISNTEQLKKPTQYITSSIIHTWKAPP